MTTTQTIAPGEDGARGGVETTKASPGREQIILTKEFGTGERIFLFMSPVCPVLEVVVR